MGLTWADKSHLIKYIMKNEGLGIKDAVKKANRLISNSYRLKLYRNSNRKDSISRIYV